MAKIEIQDATDVAKLIRKELKAAFPGQKFSVRVDRYSLGSSIDVRWTDGPTIKQVEAQTRKHEAHKFGPDYVFAHREISHLQAKKAEAIRWLYGNVNLIGNTGNPDIDQYGNYPVALTALQMIEQRRAGDSLLDAFKRI